AATANQATDATQAAGPSASPRSSDAEPPPSAQTSSSNLRSPLRQPNKGGANLADDELLADGPDLTLEFKRKVLALSRALKDTNHYELLGVERGATKKEIKDAYFAKVQLFHGDRFFNKALGSYKAKIDQIFSALTRANDALTRK